MVKNSVGLGRLPAVVAGWLARGDPWPFLKHAPHFRAKGYLRQMPSKMPPEKTTPFRE